MMIRTLLPRALALALVGLVAGACADAPSAPSAPSAAAPVVPFLKTFYRGDTLVGEFVVTPGRSQTHAVSALRITVPAGAICDPSLSTYGPTEWEKPCVRKQTPTPITVKAWIDAEQHPHVEFHPELRFAPDRNVMLMLRDRAAAATPERYTLYWTGPDGIPVDESITDPSLRLTVNGLGFLQRRIKHFSGYNIALGRNLANESDSEEIY